MKTHKTGGTTVTNTLLRYAENNKLNVGLPIAYHWEMAGYPASFDARLIDPQIERYNVLCHHMKFDKENVRKLMSDDAKYITILRDPVQNFESAFGFFKDYPYPEWNLEGQAGINSFLDEPERFYNKSTPWYFRAKNYMSFDLGFDHENDSDGYIKQVISEMESTYNFVMMTDYFEESMILLKDLLCLDMDDIVYLPLKVRTDDNRQRVSTETAAKIKKWNKLDTA